ncbi:hypothetical protein, partial [Klebsiella pneumoniae]|uniref:hypothetical protein n=1 Tax=Klebsiella pneumoniae TaxID=573 RepID=UPI001D0F1BE6
ANKSDLIEGIEYTENQIRKQFTREEIVNTYFITDSTPIGSEGYLPESKIKSLEQPINTSIANYKARRK